MAGPGQLDRHRGQGFMVAQPFIHPPFRMDPCDFLHPLNICCIQFLNQIQVTVIEIEIILGDEKGRFPTEATIIYSHKGCGIHKKGVIHGVHPVIEGFPVECLHVKIIDEGFTGGIQIAAITKFFPGRAIGLHTNQVGQKSSFRDLLDRIQQRRCGGKVVVVLHIRMDKKPPDIFLERLRSKSSDLHIPVRVIGELRREPGLAGLADDVVVFLPGNVRSTRATHTFSLDLSGNGRHRIEGAVLIDPFSKSHGDGIPCLTGYFDPVGAGKIDSHIDHPNSGRRTVNSFRVDFLGDLNRREKCFL